MNRLALTDIAIATRPELVRIAIERSRWNLLPGVWHHDGRRRARAASLDCCTGSIDPRRPIPPDWLAVNGERVVHVHHADIGRCECRAIRSRVALGDDARFCRSVDGSRTIARCDSRRGCADRIDCVSDSLVACDDRFARPREKDRVARVRIATQGVPGKNSRSSAFGYNRTGGAASDNFRAYDRLIIDRVQIKRLVCRLYRPADDLAGAGVGVDANAVIARRLDSDLAADHLDAVLG